MDSADPAHVLSFVLPKVDKKHILKHELQMLKGFQLALLLSTSVYVAHGVKSGLQRIDWNTDQHEISAISAWLHLMRYTKD